MAFVYCGGIITGIHRQAPKALQEPKTLSKDKSHFSKQPLTFPQSFVDTQFLPVTWHLLLLATFWPKHKEFPFYIAAEEKNSAKHR